MSRGVLLGYTQQAKGPNKYHPIVKKRTIDKRVLHIPEPGLYRGLCDCTIREMIEVTSIVNRRVCKMCLSRFEASAKKQGALARTYMPLIAGVM